MTLVEVQPGVRIFAQDLGPKGRPAVVLVPGFGMTHEAWDRQVRVLTDAGHRVVAIDQRGHGRSDKPLTGYDVARLSDDLLAVLDDLSVETCALVGWSFGGAEPTIAAMVEFEERDRFAARRTTIRSGFGTDPSPAVVEWMTNQSLQMPSWAAVACYQSMLSTDLLADITAVTQPVLQVIGADDPVHSAKGAHWLADQLADTRLAVIPHCGHYPMFEAAAVLDGHLLEFLAP